MIAIRELSPANDSDRKKTIAKNLPPLMLPNNSGILQDANTITMSALSPVLLPLAACRFCLYLAIYRFAHHINVRPEFPGPLYCSVSTIWVLVCPIPLWTENTVQNIMMPQIRLTMLLKSGVIVPSLTAPWVRFINVAYVRNIPSPASVTLSCQVIYQASDMHSACVRNVS